MPSIRGDYQIQELVHLVGQEFLGGLLPVEGPRHQRGLPLLVHLERRPVVTNHVVHLLSHRRLGFASDAPLLPALRPGGTWAQVLKQYMSPCESETG